MIRLFTKICKCFKQISSENEIDIFNDYIESLDIDSLACPSCSAKHALSPFASYERNLVTYDDEKACQHIIIIPRYICSSCGHTHAILPSVIVPYLSFSFKFIVSIIHDYITKKFNSVETMCSHYTIAISTFYRIFKTFKEHKTLWLGLLEDALISDLTFLQALRSMCLSETEEFIHRFLKQNGISFFQETSRTG